ncbi:MAG: nuclear transport factor 2 family protein [Flavobacteriales bacterium]|nr:nuclear transport factor 2 family protein [Flavobacteriales bacterium]
MKTVFILIAAMITISSCETKTPKGLSSPFLGELEKMMNEQQNCWNSADLECFMSYYWKSDSLQFLSKNGLSNGWQKVMNNYQKGYPTPEKMGKLDFEILETKNLGNVSALMLGKWKVSRTSDTLQGHFSLLWQRKGGEWKIVLDHTS